LEDNAGNFMRMEAEIQGMKNATRTGNAEESF